MWKVARQTKYIYICNIEARPGNKFGHGKAISIKHYVCLCAWLSQRTCKAHAPYCLWPVWLYQIFHIISYTERLSEEKKVTAHKMCGFMFCTNFLRNTSILRRIRRDIRLYVKCPPILSDFN